MKIILASILIITFAFNVCAELPPDEQMPMVSAWDDNWTKKHVKEIIKGANAGVVEAQLTLASIYEMGGFFNRTPGIETIEKNDDQAILWYRKAANQLSWEALNNLAVMYYHGRGVEQDHGKALELLKEAWASQEEQIAANLAFYYMNITIGGQPYPNYIEASKWYKISAEAENWYSQYEYGKLCESGLGALKDKVEALKWYYLSSAKGHIPANQAAASVELELDRAEINLALGDAKKFLSNKTLVQSPPTKKTRCFPNVKPEHLLTIIATLIAAIVAWVGYQQHKLAKEKLKIDLFEKRFAVYKGVQRFLSFILSNATYTMDEFYAFRRDTQDGTFLFRKEIPNYISEIDSKALSLKSTADQLKDLPKGDKRTELVKQNTQLLTELTDELPRLKEVFAPYLRFDKWK